MFRAVVFDVDGVLLTFKSSWEMVHRAFGSRGSLEDMKKYFKGEISYEEWCRRDWERWRAARQGVSAEDVRKVFEGIERYLHPYAAESVRLSKRRGMAVGLLSAGLAASTSRVAELLGVHLWLANPCWPCEAVVEPKDKAKGLLKLLEKIDISVKETIYVGDNIIDVPAMLAAGCSIGVGDEQLRPFSTYWIKDLSSFEEALLQCINHPRSVDSYPHYEEYEYGHGEGYYLDWVRLLDLD
ncbi:MAG: HAD-IB family phosphatase [Crenarchaeota archaeon]|nr:HAD-IB family phosphatase [Thermoproteota archaeon]